MKFWAKAERVVNYKNKSVVDARKKEAMDKHLTYLVEQTQRYSSMLAQRLHSGKSYPLLVKSVGLEGRESIRIMGNGEKLWLYKQSEH